MNDAKQKIDQLKQLIRTWDYEYYVLDSPTVEDAEYDAKMRELKALESEHPDLVTADSPTRRVSGTPLREFQTVRHRVPLLSLDNTFSLE